MPYLLGYDLKRPRSPHGAAIRRQTDQINDSVQSPSHAESALALLQTDAAMYAHVV